MAKPNLRIEVDHGLTQTDALERIRELITRLEAQFFGKITNVRQAWNGARNTFSFDAFGQHIIGVLSVLDTKIVLTATLPFAALLFKKQIEGAIHTHAQSLLRVA